MKELSKIQQAEITEELINKVMEMIDKYEEKYKVTVVYNFTVDRVKVAKGKH